MSRTNDGVRSGLATVVEVGDYYCNESECVYNSKEDVSVASRTLSLALSADNTRRSAIAIACAVLNTQFAKTGWLFDVDDKCKVDFTHIDSLNARRATAIEFGL